MSDKHLNAAALKVMYFLLNRENSKTKALFPSHLRLSEDTKLSERQVRRGIKSLINENYIVIFWIHFLTLNLFCGSWIVKDYQKINMPKALAFIPIVLTYFIGPLGISVYWLFRIFFSKKIDLYD